MELQEQAAATLNVPRLLLALAALLALARCLGELVHRFRQPAVVGEILAGVLLGPTVLGHLWPELSFNLFPATGVDATARNAMVQVAIVLFLVVAGMEVDLSAIWRQGRSAMVVSATGMIVPFALGFAAAWVAPRWMGAEPDAEHLLFALFVATAMSISALPVIAKTLMDLDLYRTDVGMLTIACAVVDDLTGWIVFAVIIGRLGLHPGHDLSVGVVIALVLGTAAFMLTAGRALVHRALPWVEREFGGSGGVVAFALVLALLCGAVTEWIGVHAIFGAFLVGIAIGDSSHLRDHTRRTLDHFISFFFAPLFFASIGLKVDFARHFDPLLVLSVLAIACAGKFLGVKLGARWARLPRRESWAVAFGMNARGAMDVVLALLAFDFGLIGERMFVAIVVMALVTSMIAGPAMRALFDRKTARRALSFVPRRGFVAPLLARTREEVIGELCRALELSGGPPLATSEPAVLAREAQAPTGLGHELAVPHARLPGLRAPTVAVGLSRDGVDFDAPDGRPARLVFLILSPLQDDSAQVEILADIARRFADPDLRDRATRARSLEELVLVADSATPAGAGPEPEPA